MVKINPTGIEKFIECTGKYKSGGTFNLRMKSTAPRKYELDCFSLNKEGNVVGGYGETYGEGTVEGFAEWSKNFITKLQKHSDDLNVINKVSEFFTSISK